MRHTNVSISTKYEQPRFNFTFDNIHTPLQYASSVHILKNL